MYIRYRINDVSLVRSCFFIIKRKYRLEYNIYDIKVDIREVSSTFELEFSDALITTWMKASVDLFL